MDLRKKLFEILPKQEIVILELKKNESTLEDAFIKLINNTTEQNENVEPEKEMLKKEKEEKKEAKKQEKLKQKQAKKESLPFALRNALFFSYFDRDLHRSISNCRPTALCPRITFSISFRFEDSRSPGIVFFTALVALPISRAR